jgi:hypothetical protein
MSAGPPRAPTMTTELDRIVSQFFDPQLRRLGLTEDQIKHQDLAELEVSLQKVNDAVDKPDSFGKVRVKFGGEFGAVIVMSASDYHVELGILPLLLERKGQILDRIRALRPEQQLNELREDIASNVDDPQARDHLIKVIDQRFEQQREAREKLDHEQAQVEAERIEAREREQRLQIEIRERRSAIYHSFLERESVASVVGALLLLALAATLIIAMFTHVATSVIIANSFLLILGYFFGQATTRDRISEPARRRSRTERSSEDVEI